MATRERIPNRAELRAMVAKALARTEAKAAEDPASKLPPLIRPQLEFMARCLDQNCSPTLDERQRLNVGQVGVRNYDEVDPEYAHWLATLNYWFRRWKQIP